MTKLTLDAFDKNIPLCFKTPEFNLFYHNKEAFQDIYQEVFINKIYQFKSDKPNPTIIDAGSNIGLSTLFFKMHYPHAKVSCFEPDLHSFLLLKKNIFENKLSDVSLINAALSKKDGYISFYGEANGTTSDSRGNSIFNIWGEQRQSSTKILVKSARLSHFINEEIDFLKMDIEGAEQQVLEELGDKLKLVREITLEVHETANMTLKNSLKGVCSVLEKHGFTLDVQFQDIIPILPKQIKKWVERVNPKFYSVNAKRIL